MSNDTGVTDTPRPRPGSSLGRPVAIAAAVVVVLIGGVVVWTTTRGDETVPYDDQASSGLLTLCDERGRAVTGGKITDKPLAPIVLGETPLDQQVAADAPALSTLYGYQPREGVDPLEFSGAPIGGPVAFVDHDRPATRVVKEGYSLANFTAIYPAKVDGYVQLRLINSAEGFGAFTSAYDTADIKIDGDRWKLVRGGTASCTDAASLLVDG